jgi:hypothetical protein
MKNESFTGEVIDIKRIKKSQQKIQIIETVKENQGFTFQINFFQDEIIFIGTNEYLYMHILKFKEDEFELDEIPKEKLSKFYFIFPTNHFFGKGILSNNQKIIQNIQIDSLNNRCIVLFGLDFFFISHLKIQKFLFFNTFTKMNMN